MKAMILAAGRGERLRPLTDHTPKPLLKVNGIPLIEHHIIKLARAGITDIVINLAWLGEKIEEYLQNGSRFGVKIHYSWEQPHALETAGGIIKALPLLVNPDADDKRQELFLVINGDIYFDYDFTLLPVLGKEDLAHLWLVPNPEHNRDGDFVLSANRVSTLSAAELTHHQESYTFSGVGLYKADLFYQLAESEAYENGVLRLGPSLKKCAQQGLLAGELSSHFWTDVGTAERLQQVNLQVGVKG
ncbi:N-acetylmuramate alpha-1-phosphate uridylyltransferase MurU [Thalassotalea piscium]